MRTLLAQARRHRSACLFFGGYSLGWLALEKIATIAAHAATLDPCGRGSLVGYPIVLGILLSLAYGFFLLLRGWWHKESRRFYLTLLLLAGVVPMLGAFVV